MKTFKFRGTTPLDALAKARLELGDDCMLINIKEIIEDNTKKEIIYEISVEINEELIPKEYK